MKASEVIKRYEVFVPKNFLWRVIVVDCRLDFRQGHPKSYGGP